MVPISSFQVAAPDSMITPTVAQVTPSSPDAFSIGSLLDLSGQAGGFEWPIFAVLVAGLLVLALAFVRLVFEWRAARSLRTLPLDYLDPRDLKTALEQSADSLYARLAVGMIELLGAGAGVAALQQDSVHAVGLAGAPYRRTERVITFLSSTAGGLGLLGTLVGIYLLFSAGARDAQTIFAGIGIAVISTLLGIVVAIVLELLEVLTTGWARRYQEEAEAWASQLRYRLLELDATMQGKTSPITLTAQGNGAVTSNDLEVERVGTIPNRVRPGQEVGPLGVRALLAGRPAEGVPVVLRIKEGEGRFASGAQQLETKTTDTGIVAFTLTTGNEEGLNVVEADVEGARVCFSITTTTRRS